MNLSRYQQLYQQSIDYPAVFWAEQARQSVSWFTPFQGVMVGDFQSNNVEWFVNGQLNVSYNCLDRHLLTRKDQIALIWEGNTPGDSRSLTYQQLYEKTCQFANVLKDRGVKKGDRVAIYLPMIPEAVIAMLACARIGAVHSVIFAGFSAEALKSRMMDAACCVLITADEGRRGDKSIPLKNASDESLDDCPDVHTVIVIQHTGTQAIAWHASRDIWYHEAMSQASLDCPPSIMDANDPLFILYTSGSTGKPKGVLHGTGGYLVYVAMSYRYVFHPNEGDIHWCTADIGWITGHSYLVYGPLANGATTLMFEGVPNYPSFSRYWEIIDKYLVTHFYTAPTAIRALRREGDEWVKRSERKSLKLLGTVGEPINQEVWSWYFDVVGEGRCSIVNTWWQTETGGIMLTQIPSVTPLMFDSVGWPFFGIQPEIIDEADRPLKPMEVGRLVIKSPWPGMMQTIYGDRQRFIDPYFTSVPGYYYTGDGAYRSESGHYWITGRNDDVIMVSGHRIGTGEVESALVMHPAVAEAAAVAVADDIKGESIDAFVTLKADIQLSDQLKKELIITVRERIGPIAAPERIHWAKALPKTRSGKIMRRVLKKIANGVHDDFGDLSTLADSTVVDALIETFYKR